MWFTVLYTHQKTKKRKVWQDGAMKWDEAARKGVLFGEERKPPALGANFFPRYKADTLIGEEIEFDRYLVTVEGPWEGDGGEEESGKGDSIQGSPAGGERKAQPPLNAPQATAPAAIRPRRRRGGLGLRRGFCPPSRTSPLPALQDQGAEEGPNGREGGRSPPMRRSATESRNPMTFSRVTVDGSRGSASAEPPPHREDLPATSAPPQPLLPSNPLANGMDLGRSPLRERSQAATLAWLDGLADAEAPSPSRTRSPKRVHFAPLPPPSDSSRQALPIPSSSSHTAAPAAPAVAGGGGSRGNGRAPLTRSVSQRPLSASVLRFPPPQWVKLPKVEAGVWPRVRLEGSYTSVEAYITRVGEALRQDVHARLAEDAHKYWSAVKECYPELLGGGRTLSLDMARLHVLQGNARRRGARFYGSARLFCSRREGNTARWFLKLEDRFAVTSFAKDDLWVLSTTPLFDERAPTQSCLPAPPPLPGSRQARPSPRPWVWLARAVFHGPSKDNLLEIRPLPWVGAGDKPSGCHEDKAGSKREERAGEDGGGEESDDDAEVWEAMYPKKPRGGCLSVCALHGPNLGTDVLMWRTMARVLSGTCHAPLLPFLLNPSCPTLPSPPLPLSLPLAAVPSPDSSFRDAITAHVVTDLGLNEDQAEVLRRVARSVPLAETDAVDEPPVLLVHGVFGAGKSLLLVAVVLLLTRLWGHPSQVPEIEEAKARPGRILLASATNTAVDGVLEHLQRCGFTNFARVGSLRKIAKPLLPHVMHHSATPSGLQRAQRGLRQMLDREGTWEEGGEAVDVDRDGVESALAQLDSKHLSQHALRHAPVVGVTCAAMSFPVLRGMEFDVLLLDESSQMIEPLSLLPMVRFNCRKLIAVGDPLQLPPTLVSPPDEQQAAASLSERRDLSWTLFERLAEGGLPCVMLRTQYRCHPDLAGLCSRLFYDGRLLDGIGPLDRPPLLPGLNPLTVVDCPPSGPGSGERWVAARGSFVNDLEATVCARAVRELLRARVPPERIGVICLYRAQVGRVRDRIRVLGEEHAKTNASGLRALQVSTVDAFQGAERDVILVSCCRTQASMSAFVEHPARLNVALSRARHHLIVVGSVSALQSSPRWQAILSAARTTPGGVRSAQGRNGHLLLRPSTAKRPRAESRLPGEEEGGGGREEGGGGEEGEGGWHGTGGIEENALVGDEESGSQGKRRRVEDVEGATALEDDGDGEVAAVDHDMGFNDTEDFV